MKVYEIYQVSYVFSFISQ